MDSIRLDLDYLDSVLSSQGAIFSFNINGQLQRLAGFLKPVDTIALYNEFKPNKVRALLKKSGTGGNLQIDMRKITTPRIPIIGVEHLYEGLTQSIGNINPGLATQSIQRSTPQIATQSITYAKAAPNVTSIVNVGGNLWRYNLDSTPDIDWATAKVTFAGCTASGNNGTFAIVELNQSGYNCVVVSNATGAAQAGAAGTAQVNIMSYNFTNPVSSQFLAGDSAVFAAHTTSANNGTFPIFKKNQGGNNIWIINVGATQGTVTGNANNLIWIYTFLAAASADFNPGELGKFISHTSGGNNGNLLIRSVNTGGNNLYVYNTAGVAQAGVAGNAGTNRWSYGLGSDPSVFISAGDSVQLEGHTAPGNNLITPVVQVNRLATNNIIVYNVNGVTQGTAVGFVRSVKKLIQFSSDQSANFVTGTSLVDMIELIDPNYNYNDNVDAFLVLAQNFGGGANFNIVISVPGGSSQANPAGYTYAEYKSILTAPFIIAANPTGLQENKFVSAVTTNVDPTIIADQVPVGLFILSIPDGDPKDLTVIMH